jgi:predicted DCC family thiol-disulfide oxidoreductase YuxK
MNIQSNGSTVFFDGSCPICTAEINQYKALTPMTKIQWLDVTQSSFIPPEGQTIEQLMERFHVLNHNAELLSGAAAFVYLWKQLPGWKRLAAIEKIPGAMQVLEFGYTKFLKIRPKVQLLFKKN